jgi:nucleoside-diphosphate-sugar epimerase
VKIIANEGGKADGQIYNIGNPDNNYSVKELANMMLEMAKHYPEYAEGLSKVNVEETTSTEYYGKGYQDVQNRVPKIDNTKTDLSWKPETEMKDALGHIFEYYRSHVAQARELMN